MMTLAEETRSEQLWTELNTVADLIEAKDWAALEKHFNVKLIVKALEDTYVH